MIEFEELKTKYLDLKQVLEDKKQLLIHKGDVEELYKLDEKLICIYGQIKAIGQNKDQLALNQGQKDELNELAETINRLQNDNEVLIVHQMSVINKLFEGILNITSSSKDEYNRQGKKNQNNDFDISSITEEA